MEEQSQSRIPLHPSDRSRSAIPVAKDVRYMQNKQTTLQPHGMTLGDIYYILFRHKWKIIACSVLGIIVAITLFFFKPIPYQSEAKLFIRYVLDSKSLNPAGNLAAADSRVKSPDERGENIINSEIEILTSLDLAQQVADVIGPEKILAKVGGGKDRNKAAWFIQRNLTGEATKKSSVILLTFQHPDPEMVQAILHEMIDDYFKKHIEIHRAIGVLDDFLTQQTDQLRSQLAQTEQELRQARAKAGVISLDESKKAFTAQIAKIREDLFNAQAELAERQAALKEVGKSLPASTPSFNVGEAVPAEAADEYKSLVTRLDLLRKQEQALLMEFTDDNVRVKEIREEIAEADKLKKKTEAKYPKLAIQGVDLPVEAARVAALESKIKSLNEQLNQVRAETTSMDAMEPSIVELQRKKELEEANYRYFSANLEQSRIDEALSAVKVSNISLIQSPSPPFRNSIAMFKMIGIAILGGVFIGLAWAFLIELIFDRSIKRPIEVERKLGLHLFLSIPDMTRNGHRRHPMTNGTWEVGELKDDGEMESKGELVRAPWSCHSTLRPFYEALRDRLVVYFEVRDFTMKPKLIAVTGVSQGAGVTLTAVGLAASLSETGDGNVLLVDMHPEHEAAQHFYKGKPVCELHHALSTKDRALVQNNLYVVTGGSFADKLPQTFPKRFTNQVLELKVSDYDYIIFDMPPVTQTSVTPRLAGSMDMVLFVIEAEKTDREIVRQANALLTDSKANVCAVLNKTRSYVPSWLHQDFLSEC